ncbi:unnamed protein product [Symbiodinium natans]|uniref:Uncharacterized protein n=1 Tax=Symbiodinium natans TaxID=878477 RepID=A0A812SKG2_9DINO|nr:unnamed protein product [Symbiodinium natans]
MASLHSIGDSTCRPDVLAAAIKNKQTRGADEDFGVKLSEKFQAFFHWPLGTKHCSERWLAPQWRCAQKVQASRCESCCCLS